MFPRPPRGAIQGKITITAAGVSQTINVKLTVAGAVLDDHGDRDSWRLSRLRWLDSTIGLDDNVVTQPFVPIARNANTLKILGRELVLGSDGLPRADPLVLQRRQHRHRQAADPRAARGALPLRGGDGRGTGEVRAGEDHFHLANSRAR